MVTEATHFVNAILENKYGPETKVPKFITAVIKSFYFQVEGISRHIQGEIKCHSIKLLIKNVYNTGTVSGTGKGIYKLIENVTINKIPTPINLKCTLSVLIESINITIL